MRSICLKNRHPAPPPPNQKKTEIRDLRASEIAGSVLVSVPPSRQDASSSRRSDCVSLGNKCVPSKAVWRHSVSKSDIRQPAGLRECATRGLRCEPRHPAGVHTYKYPFDGPLLA
jgi:hypothetical protein